MNVDCREIIAGTVSEAWLKAVELVNARPGRAVYHLVVRIGVPDTEERQTRQLVDALLREL